MSKNKKYRYDKTCLNCRHVVQEKFCPNCGQENTDTRKTFHHLFLHFFEDLTHYENAFWRTIKNLLLRPGALTKEYLSGKRLSYLAPVRLYIFISFVTFFTISIIGTNDFIKLNQEGKEVSSKVKDSLYMDQISNALKSQTDINDKKKRDEMLKIVEQYNENQKKSKLTVELNGIRSVKALDSIQKSGRKEQKRGKLAYWMTKKLLLIKETYTTREILEKATTSFKQNSPKVLIIYMPFFAFFLWLFHSKKRWYYFDHGIFTLHYFSFLLIMVLVMSLLGAFYDSLVESQVFDAIYVILNIGGWLWTLYYFFPAHHRFYGETRWKSFFKSSLLLIINYFFVLIFLIIFAFYTIINIH